MSTKSKIPLLTVYCLLFTVFLWAAPLSFAQAHTGRARINGVVSDEENNPLEGVSIIAQGVNHSVKFEDKTNKKGKFAIFGLGSGLWRITASKSGYASVHVDTDVKQMSKNPPINFILEKLTGFDGLFADEDFSELYEKGDLLLKEKKYDEALEAFSELKEKYPEVYQVHLNTGTCYLRKKEFDNAEQEFRLFLDRIMEVHGDYKADKQSSMKAFVQLGESSLLQKDLEKALEYFDQSLEISPDDELAAHNVGQLLFNNRKIDDAIKYYETAININKEWSLPYMRLGYAYLNKGDFSKAIEYFDKFVTMDPENPKTPQVKQKISDLEKMKK
ncbi:MAG: tetratricopeptide repeat protein [Candidatus Hodarchaeota archaeon]